MPAYSCQTITLTYQCRRRLHMISALHHNTISALDNIGKSGWSALAHGMRTLKHKIYLLVPVQKHTHETNNSHSPDRGSNSYYDYCIVAAWACRWRSGFHWQCYLGFEARYRKADAFSLHGSLRKVTVTTWCSKFCGKRLCRPLNLQCIHGRNM